MADFKKTTHWFATDKGEASRLEYGFTCLRGNRGPYFSVMHETRSQRERGLVSCGCAAREMASKCGLDDAVAFHLFEPQRGPIHYEVNALFRLKQDAGDYDDAEGSDRCLRPKEYDRPWEFFLSTVCWGALAEDAAVTTMGQLRRDLHDISDDGRRLWLANRLPKLVARFAEIVEQLGLRNELDQALAFFSEGNDDV